MKFLVDFEHLTTMNIHGRPKELLALTKFLETVAMADTPYKAETRIDGLNITCKIQQD